MKSEHQKEFEQHYESKGTWAKFFSRGKGFIGTHLFKDVSDSLRYLTLDQWETAEDFEAFEKELKEEYSSIDKLFEKLTQRETRLGSWISGGS